MHPAEYALASPAASFSLVLSLAASFPLFLSLEPAVELGLTRYIVFRVAFALIVLVTGNIRTGEPCVPRGSCNSTVPGRTNFS